MNGGAAVRTFLLKHLTAHCAEPSADWVGGRTVRTIAVANTDLVHMVCRTLWIRTKPHTGNKTSALCAMRIAAVTARQRLCHVDVYAEFPGKPFHDSIVELCSIPLLEHRQRRLLAPYFGCKLALRKPMCSTGFLYLQANDWIELCHVRILWTLFYQLARGYLSTLST